MNPLVSVIITTYGIPYSLERSIQSVLDQTYNNIEIIVVDDNDLNSLNRKYTEQIINTYINKKNIKYFKHKFNKNGAAARNTGIKHAKGQYITFLDSDDFLFPERIAKSIELLLDKNSDVVLCNAIIIRNNIPIKLGIINKCENYCKKLLLDWDFLLTGSNMFFSKKVIEEIGDFDVSFNRHQDVEYCLRVFSKFPIILLEEFLIVKDNSKDGVCNYEKLKQANDLLFLKFKDNINKIDEKEKKYLYDKKYSYFLKNAYLNCVNKKEVEWIITNLKNYRNISLKEEKIFKYYNIYKFIFKIKKNILKLPIKIYLQKLKASKSRVDLKSIIKEENIEYLNKWR